MSEQSSHIKASIIIPAYNEAEYIGATLRSALAQDLPERFEIIVVDNASSDNTVQVAEGFSAVTVVTENQKGVQFARERGRKEAKGKILAYLDADCRPPKEWLRKGVAYFARPQVVGVSGPYGFYDSSRLMHWISLAIQNTLYRSVHFLVQHVLHRGAVMMGGNSFFKADALEKIGGFNTTIKFYGDDTDTAKRLSKMGTVLYRPEVMLASSARRFKRMGAITVLFIYILNFIWVTVFNRPFSQ